MKKEEDIVVSFSDPRLAMSAFGRAFVRSAAFISYSLLTVFSAIGILSDIPFVRSAALLAGLFLLSTFRHRKNADFSLSDIGTASSANLARFLTPAAYKAIEKAYDRSLMGKGDFYLYAAHVLLALPESKEALVRLDISPEEFRQKIEDAITADSSADTPEAVRAKAANLAAKAFSEAAQMRHAYIETSDLFSAIPSVPADSVSRVCGIFNIRPGDLRKALIFSVSKNKAFAVSGIGAARFSSFKRHKIVNQAWTSRPTPILDTYSSDVTDIARMGYTGFLVGHEDDYKRLEGALSRPSNPNAILVGPEGVGKETLVGHLAFNIVEDHAPVALSDMRLVELEISSLVSGATGEELVARIKAITDEILAAGNIILYIPDIHNLVKSAGSAFMSAADAFLPVIRSNAFPVIGATYPHEFKEFIQTRSDFVGQFEVINVQELSDEAAQELLIYEMVPLEIKHKILITFGAVREAVALCKKHFRTKPLPGSAEDLLKEVVAIAVQNREKIVNSAAVISLAETKTNVPIHAASEKEAATLLNLEKIIHEKMVDQEEAVKAVSQALREYRSGLTRAKGPIASFLFVGPTGVGKTELAKNLARIQFGSEDAMVRFDMTEYQDKASYVRFIGTPDQAVSGVLTATVLQKPYCLILLDELEKAYPDILNLFLQVLDDGRLTDNLGQVADFSNCIIIATSNAHSDFIAQALSEGKKVPEISEEMKKKLVDVFRPEFLNRFSKVIVFKSLSREDVGQIAVMNLKDLSSLASAQGITLTFSDEAVSRIADWGFDPVFGARPLRQVISDKIRAPLSEMILRQEAVRGSSFVVELQGDALVFTRKG